MSKNPDRMSFSEELKYTPMQKGKEETKGERREKKETLDEKDLIKKIEQVENNSDIIEILKKENSLQFLKSNREILKQKDTKLGKIINKKVKEEYKQVLENQTNPEELLEIANKVKQIHLIEKEVGFPDLCHLSELDDEIMKKLQETEKIHLPEENQSLQDAMSKQVMEAGYIEEGKMIGVPIEEMKFSEVQADGRKDFYLIAREKLVGIISVGEKTAIRKDIKRGEDIIYTPDFTPEKWKRIQENATLLTEKEKENPLERIYEDLPEIDLDQGLDLQILK